MCATLLAGVIALALPGPPAGAIPPPVFPDGANRTYTFTNTTPVAISAVAPVLVTSTIFVPEARGLAWDVDVTTNIQHTFAADLDIALTSPSGVVVTLTTDNGGSNNNVFNGTIWDDDVDPGGTLPYTANNNFVTEHTYANNVVVPTLVPEEPLGNHRGSNVVGTWTLTISDDLAGEGGTLTSWGVTVTTIEAFPNISPPIPFASTSAVPISAGAPGVVTSPVAVTTPHTYVCIVLVTTNITHTWSNDLDVTVTSPAGTVVTLTTDNGGSLNNVFAGTSWSDSHDYLGGLPSGPQSAVVTDHVFSADGAVAELAPEEGLSGFVGENPNGVWTLTVSDDFLGEGGSIVSWSVSVIGCEYIDEFKGLAPARLLETRPGLTTIDGVSQGGGAVGASSTTVLPVVGRGGVPTVGVGAVALNVTAVDPTASTFVTVFPAGATRPVASNVNAAPGRTVPNMVIVPVGTDGANAGKIALYNNAGTTHLVVDVLGWLPAGVGYQGMNPARLLETRPGLTTVDGLFQTGVPIGPGATLDLRVSARAGLSGASSLGAVVLNVTAIDPTVATYITVFPKGVPRPLASNLNVAAGQTVANLVIVPLGTDGQVSLYNNAGVTNLVVDVLGSFRTISPFFGLTPARLLETRPGLTTLDGLYQTGHALGGGQTLALPVGGRGGTVSGGGVTTKLVALNVTVVNPTASSFVTVFPGAVMPTASNLNFTAGQTVSNMVVVPVGPGGSVWIYNNSGDVDLVVDILGWVPTL